MAFDPNSLAPLIGGINPQGGNAFMRGWQRGQQEIAQRKQQQQQQTVQQEQLGFQRDANTRANQDQELQQQAQRVQAVNSLRTLLGDESIDDPTVFDERFTFAQNLAPQLDVDPGFLQTLRPTPDTFTKRKLKKLLAQHEGRSVQERQEFEAAGVWRIGDQTYTPAQARQALGVGGLNAQTGQPFAFSAPQQEPKPETRSIAVQAADALRRGDMEEYNRLLRVQREVGTADNAPTDPRLAEINRQIAELRLQGLQTGQATGELPPRTQRAVDAQVNAFRNEASVKRANIIAEGVSFVDSVPDTTSSPTEHQALIYAFAKAGGPRGRIRHGQKIRPELVR
jgi:hypothetical protein